MLWLVPFLFSSSLDQVVEFFLLVAMQVNALLDQRAGIFDQFIRCQGTGARFRNRNLKVSVAPEPSDIWHENADYSDFARGLRSIVSLLSLSAVLLTGGVIQVRFVPYSYNLLLLALMFLFPSICAVLPGERACQSASRHIDSGRVERDPNSERIPRNRFCYRYSCDTHQLHFCIHGQMADKLRKAAHTKLVRSYACCAAEHCSIAKRYHTRLRDCPQKSVQ